MNKNQRELQILEVLAEQGSLHARRISEEVGEHPLSVDRMCSHLHEKGEIHSCNHGHYQLTQHGKERLIGEIN